MPALVLFTAHPAPVRVERGDVIIALSPRPDDHLLMQRSFLEQFPYFARSIASQQRIYEERTSEASGIEEWFGRLAIEASENQGQASTCVQEVQDPDTGTTTITFRYGLQLSDDLDEEDMYYFLNPDLPDPILEVFDPDHQEEEIDPDRQDKDSHKDHQDKDCRCHVCLGRTKFLWQYNNRYGRKSDDEDWSFYFIDANAQELAILAHKVLFRLLHELSVDLSQLSTREFFNCIAEIAAYADHYLVLPNIAEDIEDLILARPEVWTDIAQNPLFYLPLANRIRSSTLYSDALQHIVGARQEFQLYACLRLDHELKPIKDLDSDEIELAILVNEKRDELSRITNAIRIELMGIGMTRDKLTAGGTKPRWFLATFLRFMRAKSEHRKIDFIARSVYNEWLCRHLGGWSLNITNSHVGFVSEPHIFESLLRKTCNLIIQHAKDKDVSCFGLKAPERLTEIFALGGAEFKRPEAIRLLEEKLLKILEDASANIHWKLVGGSARHTPTKGPYFTEIPISDGDCPWVAKRLTPFEDLKVDMVWGEERPASQEWIEFVGLLQYAREASPCKPVEPSATFDTWNYFPVFE